MIVKKITIGKDNSIDYIERVEDLEVDHKVKHQEPFHKDLVNLIDELLFVFHEISTSNIVIDVLPSQLKKHRGKILAGPITKNWVEDFVDEDSGEVISIERKQVMFSKGCVLNQSEIDEILECEPTLIKVFSDEIISTHDTAILPTTIKSIEYKHTIKDGKISVRFVFLSSNSFHIPSDSHGEIKTGYFDFKEHLNSKIQRDWQLSIKNLTDKIDEEIKLYTEGKNAFAKQLQMEM